MTDETNDPEGIPASSMADTERPPRRDLNRDAADWPQELDRVGDTPADPFRDRAPDANRDALSGAPGAHPVGAGLGAAAGGAATGALAGALAGTAAAGPVGTALGTAAGAVIGGIAGGYTGKAIAESINPTAEEAYWEHNFRSRPYVEPGGDWSCYGPAYRHGCAARARYADRKWEDVEADIRAEWERSSYAKDLDWERAQAPIRDAWNRLTRFPSQHTT